MSIGKEIQHFIPFDFQFHTSWKKLNLMDCIQIITERLHTFIVKQKSVQEMKKVHVRQKELQTVRKTDLNQYFWWKSVSFFFRKIVIFWQISDEKWQFFGRFWHVRSVNSRPLAHTTTGACLKIQANPAISKMLQRLFTCQPPSKSRWHGEILLKTTKAISPLEKIVL